MKKLTAMITVLILAFALTAYGQSTETADAYETETETAEAAGEETQPEETEFPIKNAEADPETAVMVVSFGTSYNESRDVTIGAVEDAIAAEWPDVQVRRAFTAQIIIDKLKERDGLVIDNVQEALDRAVADGVKKLVVQPTHLMNGFEYTDLADELAGYTDKFESIVLGAPLLTSDEDFNAVADALIAATSEFDDGETAICFMGHGTEADSNAVYGKMQEVIAAKNPNYIITTVEAEPSFEDCVAAVKEGGYKKAVLRPMMVVAGNHANNDMAGDEEDSLKTLLANEGVEVNCVIEGLGQLPEVQALYVEHAKAAMESLQ